MGKLARAAGIVFIPAGMVLQGCGAMGPLPTSEPAQGYPPPTPEQADPLKEGHVRFSYHRCVQEGGSILYCMGENLKQHGRDVGARPRQAEELWNNPEDPPGQDPTVK